MYKQDEIHYDILQKAREHVREFERKHPDVRIRFVVRELDAVTGEIVFEVIFRRYNKFYKRAFSVNELFVMHSWPLIFDMKLKEMYEAMLKEDET